MKTLDEILTYLEFGASIVEGLGGPVAGAGAVAEKLLGIAQAAVRAHESITGKPIDLTQLHQIAPVT